MRADALDRCIAEACKGTINADYRVGPNGQDKGTVLVVEDEQSIGLSLRSILSSFSAVFIHATRSEEAVSILRHAHFDAALLNINEPGVLGTEVCRGIRKTLPRLPILMLGVANDEDQGLEALEAGADDYIVTPFRHRDLIARLDAAIRRGRVCNGYGTVITVGDLSVDFSRRIANKNGCPIHLTPTQFKLLRVLMANLGKALSHASLLMSVWGPEYGGELEYLRTFVRQLRKKIEDDPAKPKYLLTESHFGYRLNEPVW
jgi:two-component system KDP operon response regulator KdpE